MHFYIQYFLENQERFFASLEGEDWHNFLFLMVKKISFLAKCQNFVLLLTRLFFREKVSGRKSVLYYPLRNSFWGWSITYFFFCCWFYNWIWYRKSPSLPIPKRSFEQLSSTKVIESQHHIFPHRLLSKT